MDTLFFITSKAFWLILSPGSMLLLILLAGLLLLYLGINRPARRMISLATFSFLLIAVLPLDEWMALPLEQKFTNNPALPAAIDGIIVLGGPVLGRESVQWRQVEMGGGAERYLALLTLAQRFPDAQLVVSGGSGSVLNQQVREADIVKPLMLELGLDPGRLRFERESRNTWENAVNTLALVNPQAGERWLLVTSAIHMPRSVGIFCQLDWPVIPWPVDHITSPDSTLRVEFALADNLNGITSSLREWVGLLVYYLTGRSTSIYPDTC